ncbi:zf-HC2 domain-containing protein [Micromonospora sp. NBC_01813]|uniref:zf-HC2 domain-containing protein n=1 Tax=Micromonospora sp. NBC_01813 TaxID=2975988 RepID=UPI002DDA8C91|nr:zf-HC2 domain-containing protein [Micromonospora sp. NBC_01813]WSA07743.1 zf-HC2 domain-containing protein [Micromonospora sp. NBC_01813]
MGDATCRDPEMLALLGFYVVDKLEAAERVTLERHLSECASCRAERDEIDPVVPALRLLGEAEIQDLVTEFGTPTPAAAPTPDATSAPVVPSTLTRSGADRPLRRAAGPGAPPSTPPGPGRGRPKRHRRLAVGLLAMVAAVGVVTTVLVQRSDPTVPAPVGIAASGDTAEAVAMSVEVAGQTARATLTGLREGVRYELYAVTGDGQTLRLAEWTGAAGSQDVVGDLSVPAGEVAFFSVRQADGAVVVTVGVSPTTAATSVR